MNKDRVLMIIVFWILAYLNIKGYIEINEKEVFGLTIGALIISMSTCFDINIFKNDNKDKSDCSKVKKYSEIILSHRFNIIQKILYSIGFIIMFTVIFIKDNYILNEFMNKFNSNTLMLLSISVTFLSITISNVESQKFKNRIRKYYLDLFEKKIDEINNRGDRDE